MHSQLLQKDQLLPLVISGEDVLQDKHSKNGMSNYLFMTPQRGMKYVASLCQAKPAPVSSKKNYEILSYGLSFRALMPCFLSMMHAGHRNLIVGCHQPHKNEIGFISYQGNTGFDAATSG
ncbi:hypothetical protein CEXT_483101 [Caerostris extrusa]|uniref:Uncharacterized protein n=1 Tax=Caerostris extrusa TaxID=172846 RepID=A0AAV4UJG6_CAEEX|nr:hypothetical protein CEXT_483101 [Caerostris extrusa]